MVRNLFLVRKLLVGLMVSFFLCACSLDYALTESIAYNSESNTARVCADKINTLDILENSDDPNLAITEINGHAIEVGESIELDSGATLSLGEGGLLEYDGIDAWSGLSFTQTNNDSFTLTSTTENVVTTTTVNLQVEGNSAVSLAEIASSLPETIDISLSYAYDGVNFSNYLIATESSDNLRLNVTDQLAYDVDFDGSVLNLSETYSANIFIADPDDTSLATYVLHAELLDLVNYLLNQDYSQQGYSKNDIQNAIWFITDEFPSLGDPSVLAIVIDAFTNGDGFVPGPGDIVGLILAPIQEVDSGGNPTTNYQNLIYGVEYDLLARSRCD